MRTRPEPGQLASEALCEALRRLDPGFDYRPVRRRSKTYTVQVKGYGRESVLEVEAENENEAREKAMAARGIEVKVLALKGGQCST